MDDSFGLKDLISFGRKLRVEIRTDAESKPI
jgi:hypothetical protein